jgi:ankyrin repeat protein
VRNNWEQTPLWQVSWQPHDAVVTTAGILLDAGASIDAADRDGFAPLHTAVRHANLPLVEYLVSRGARHDIRTKRGTTAASMAVIHECGDCLRLLADAGADVDERDEDGSTLLYAAAARGKRDLVVSLVAAGARTDASSNGYNAVQIAAWLGHREVVEALLQGPADPNLTSEPTKVGPALNLAVERKHLDVVRVLLENGARWDIPFNGYTALQRAAWQGEVEMVAAMLDRGVSPDAGSSTHPPPLVLAAERGAIGVVRLLVERGADVNVSFQGWTALRAARRRSHTDVIAYLGANGAR